MQIREEYRVKCLQLMNEVADSGDSIAITKNGHPVAQLGPIIVRPATLAGCHKGKISIVGDIVGTLGEPIVLLPLA